MTSGGTYGSTLTLDDYYSGSYALVIRFLTKVRFGTKLDDGPLLAALTRRDSFNRRTAKVVEFVSDDGARDDNVHIADTFS